MKISFLGAGNMGTTLANLVAKKGYAATLWTIEKDVAQDINSNYKNTKYLEGISLSQNISATLDLEDAIKDSKIVVLAVPSQVVRSVAKQASEFVERDQIIVDAAKGLEKNTYKLMSEVIREEIPYNPIIAIGGPSIANELAREVPTAVVFASEDSNALETARNVFSTQYYKIRTSRDVKGVELGGAFKNIVALLGGMCDGLGYGPNTKAALVTYGLAEISELAEARGANPGTIAGLAGLGDLFVTATSKHSRNRRLGEKLGRGMSLLGSQSEMVQVTEGVEATKAAVELARQYNLNLPLINSVYAILFEDKNVEETIEEFIAE